MNKKNNITEILGTEFTEKIGEDWTFAGVLIEYWDEVGESWDENSTQITYLKDYKKYVLPLLNDLPLKDCDRTNFDRCLELLPLAKRKEGLKYDLRTERHIKWIIGKVLAVAERHGICPDILWGTDYSVPEKATDEELNEKELVKLRKSFSASEEVDIARLILEDPQQDGENFGLAAMFCLGLRNNEACGIKFGDIQPFCCDVNRYYMRIYSSTAIDSNEERFGGKTSNMARFIPIPTKLLDLLFRRRKLLCELALRGEITNDGKMEQFQDDQYVNAIVDNLPIACRGREYAISCSARVLTQAANRLLKRVAIEQEILSLIDRDIRRPGRTEEGIKEKEPTAYLFRRNLGTHLYLLGLNESEIQYIMGHDIEDDNEERSFFRNEEKLYPIAMKMEKRPIVNTIDAGISRKMHDAWLFERDVFQAEIHIPITENLKKVVVVVEQLEPLSNLKFKVKGPGDVFYEQFPCEAPIGETVNITHFYHSHFLKAARKADDRQSKDLCDNVEESIESVEGTDKK